jgi:solute carrier family 25 (mitochondrial citrate transporter), member 1
MSEDGVKKSSNPYVATLAGAIAGCVECVMVWPLEMIKTNLQLQAGSGKPQPYKGVVDGLLYTYRTTGLASLYRGLDSALVGAIPKAGIRFGSNSWFKQQLKDSNGKIDGKRQFLAGVGAGIIEAVVAVTPMETVKTKLIETNSTLIQGVRLIIKESGFAGLYQGLAPTIAKQASNQGLRFWSFNLYKDFLTDNGKKPLEIWQSLIGGMGAGCFSVLGNNPFDVIKTQMQGRNAKNYTSSFDCAAKIMKADGLAGFYKGCIPRMGRVVPGQGIIFASFETIQDVIERFFK